MVSVVTTRSFFPSSAGSICDAWRTPAEAEALCLLPAAAGGDSLPGSLCNDGLETID